MATKRDIAWHHMEKGFVIRTNENKKIYGYSKFMVEKYRHAVEVSYKKKLAVQVGRHEVPQVPLEYY